jgi:cytochrome c556
MTRKWTVLSVTMASVALLATGFSIAADDEDSPLHKIMEKVNKSNLVITKAIRTPPAFKKAQKDVVTQAEELAKLGKEARGLTEEVKKTKKPEAGANPVEKWNTLMDEFIKSSEEFAQEAAKAGVTQAQAKAAYKNVQKKCADCHAVFKSDEE